MKYKCADGVDRDKHIKRYLFLKKKTDKKIKENNKLIQEINKMEYEMMRISVDYLGSMGRNAMYEHKDYKKLDKQ